MEIWKDIQGYEGLYQISSCGRVKSLNSKRKYMKPLHATSGYLRVQLYKNGKPHDFYIHILVAQAFIPNRENKQEVNHKDGNKENNDVENLEWVSRSENQIHAIKTNLRPASPMTGRFGKDNPNSKVILQYNRDGTFIREWVGVAETARVLHCAPSQIFVCLCGKRKTGAGFIWKYKHSDNYPLQIQPVVYSCQGTRTWKQTNPRAMNRIVQLNKDGKVVKIWENYKQIEEETGFNNGNIYKAINGKLKSAYGFIWRYESK